MATPLSQLAKLLFTRVRIARMLVVAMLVAMILLSACVVIKDKTTRTETNTSKGNPAGTTTTSDGTRTAKDCEGVTPTNCPMFAPTPPGWCSDGVIKPGTFDANCCRSPPKCVRPDVPITREQCETARGHFNECGSACRTATDPNTACTLNCVQYCECGGIAGFQCPEGYSCQDYMPLGANDAMGVCKPV